MNAAHGAFGAQIPGIANASPICVLGQTTNGGNQQVISYIVDGEIRKVPVPQDWGPISIGVSPKLDAALVSSLCLKQRACALSQDIAMAFAD